MPFHLCLSAPPSIVNVSYILQQNVLEVMCTSTGSVASSVTWIKDGERVKIDGMTKLLAQNVVDRLVSTYDNSLTFYAEPGVTTGNYCCIVSNSVGSHSQCIGVTGKQLRFPQMSVIS